jgi:plasmid stability protein
VLKSEPVSVHIAKMKPIVEISDLITDKHREALEAIADAHGVSVEELLRDLLDDAIQRERNSQN